MAATTTSLSERIAAVLAIDPGAPAIEFEGRWHSWGQVATTVEAVASALPGPGTPVGVVLRNRPLHVGMLLGVLRAGACVVTINPERGLERVREDIAALGLPYLAASGDDLRNFALPGDATTLVADDLGAPVTATPGEAPGEPARGSPVRPAVALRMLTSGTTGPPRRVDLTYQTVERVLAGAKHYESSRHDVLHLRAGVAIVNSPLVHLGGVFRVLQCVNDGRSFVLLERFTVDGWVDAVRRHRPRTASLVPAALRTVLEADVDPADLSSIRSVVSGTAPLSAEDADTFTARYGIPVLVSYAATEFGGGVAGWNLTDYEQFWAAKRGSVGRAHPGCELRVVEPDDGRPLGPHEEGLLEVKGAQLGDDAGWVRTTDLARMDADGFVWIVGRADQAIIRGGFKIHPEEVCAALERHPGVRAAAVVGVPHPRLGAVPVAAVERRAGPEPVSPADLEAHASATLARYEVPVEIRIVDELPRTSSAKVDLSAVRKLFDPSTSVNGAGD